MITDHDLVLHVGMPRASSILAPALRRLRTQLRAHGVAYVDGAQIERLPHAAGWDRDRLTRRKQSARFGRELAAVVAAEQQHAGSLRRRRQVPVVVACDQLLGRGDIGRRDAEGLRPYATNAVRQVIEAVSARNVQIVLHTHRQDRLLELAYLRWLRSGQAATIEDYFPDLFEPVLDYGALVNRLRSVPRVSDVVVRPVELADAGARAFVNDNLGLIGLRDALDLYVGADLSVYPPVYSARGAALARDLNPLVRGAEFTRLQRFLSKKHSAQIEYGPPDILDPDARARMLDSYAESNQMLFEEHLPHLPADSYASEVATFALGNVLHQPAPRNSQVATKLTSAVSVRSNQTSSALRRTLAKTLRKLPPSARRQLEPLRRRFRRPA